MWLWFLCQRYGPLELGALIGSFAVFCKQIVAVLFPFFIFLAFFIRRRSVRDFHNACLGMQGLMMNLLHLYWRYFLCKFALPVWFSGYVWTCDPRCAQSLKRGQVGNVLTAHDFIFGVFGETTLHEVSTLALYMPKLCILSRWNQG